MNEPKWRRVPTSDGVLSVLLPPDWVVEALDADDPDTVLFAAPADGVDPVVSVTRERVGPEVSVDDYLTGQVIYLQEKQAGHRDHGGGAVDH